MTPWEPVGGRLGMAAGAAALVGAWIVTCSIGRCEVGVGVDDQVASLAMVALAMLVLAATSLLMTVIADRDLVHARWVAGAGIAVAVAAMVSARVLTGEIAVRSTLPASGGVDPIVQVTGTLIDRPVPATSTLLEPDVGRDRSADRTAWRMVIEVERATHPGLERRRLVIGIDVEDARLVPGVVVTLVGRLALVPPPSNPGERDRRRGRRGHVPGMLIVPSGGLIDVIGEAFDAPWNRWIDAGGEAWSRAVESVDHAVTARRPEARGVVEAVLRGDRRNLDDVVMASAEDAGVAPMLAISGWHLAIIGSFASSILGRHRPLGRGLAVAGVIAFAMVVVPGSGVQRAATMVIIGSLATIAGRRGRGLPIVLLAGAVLIWIDPSIAESTGFRLSLIATIALVAGAAAAGRRWFGAPDRVGRRRASLLRDRFTLLASASMVAWTTTAPIVLATFGRISLVGIPATVVMAPIFTGLVLTATAGVVLTLFLGFCPEASSWVIAMLAGTFVSTVEAISGIAPIQRCSVPAWTAGLSVAPAIALALASSCDRAAIRRGLWMVGGLSTLLMIIPGSHLRSGIGDRDGDGRIRIDAIAVGDGTAMLVRGGGAAVIQDAGSSSVDDSGRRIIVPTLRDLGVQRLDAIVITHANADHFNAVLDLVRAFEVDRIVVAPHLLARARMDRPSSISMLLDRLNESGVVIVEASRGDRLHFGELSWHVLHPIHGERCRTVNDESIVSVVGLRADTSGRSRLLLCGDVQDEAIARIIAREPGLHASVMELPHHGSWRPIAATLLDLVDPGVVVQSTGPHRWRMDRWKETCAGRWRGVTCRDGLVSFEIDAAGCVHPVGHGWRRCAEFGTVGSEEAETRFVTTGRGSTVGSGPDHHDGAVESASLGKDRDQHPGHAFEQGGA